MERIWIQGPGRSQLNLTLNRFMNLERLLNFPKSPVLYVQSENDTRWKYGYTKRNEEYRKR